MPRLSASEKTVLVMCSLSVLSAFLIPAGLIELAALPPSLRSTSLASVTTLYAVAVLVGFLAILLIVTIPILALILRRRLLLREDIEWLKLKRLLQRVGWPYLPVSYVLVALGFIFLPIVVDLRMQWTLLLFWLELSYFIAMFYLSTLQSSFTNTAVYLRDISAYSRASIVLSKERLDLAATFALAGLERIKLHLRNQFGWQMQQLRVAEHRLNVMISLGKLDRSSLLSLVGGMSVVPDLVEVSRKISYFVLNGNLSWADDFQPTKRQVLKYASRIGGTIGTVLVLFPTLWQFIPSEWRDTLSQQFPPGIESLAASYWKLVQSLWNLGILELLGLVLVLAVIMALRERWFFPSVSKELLRELEAGA
jgi:hypothetical protein